MKFPSIEEKLCIGCYACAVACECGVIRMEDHRYVRRILVSGFCPEDCANCEDLCPTEALSLIDQSSSKVQEITFRLVPCSQCETPIAPESMIDYLTKRTEQTLFDVRLCTSCRQRLRTA